MIAHGVIFDQLLSQSSLAYRQWNSRVSPGDRLSHQLPTDNLQLEDARDQTWGLLKVKHWFYHSATVLPLSAPRRHVTFVSASLTNAAFSPPTKP